METCAKVVLMYLQYIFKYISLYSVYMFNNCCNYLLSGVFACGIFTILIKFKDSDSIGNLETHVIFELCCIHIDFLGVKYGLDATLF